MFRLQIVYLKLSRLKKKQRAVQKSLKDGASHNIFSPALGLRSRIIAAKVYPTPQGTLEENVTISFNGREKVRSHIQKTRMKMLFIL